MNGGILKAIAKGVALKRQPKISKNVFGTPDSLKSLRGPKPELFLLKCGSQAYTYTSNIAKHGHEGPFKNQYRLRWQTRQDPLWLCFLTTRKFKGAEEAKAYRVVRSWIVRRMKVAFEASMNKNGFAKDGRRLDSNDDRHLWGTIQFMGTESTLKATGEELRAYMDRVVELLIKALQGKGRGTYSQQPPRRVHYKKRGS